MVARPGGAGSGTKGALAAGHHLSPPFAVIRQADSGGVKDNDDGYDDVGQQELRGRTTAATYNQTRQQ
jgi:hypothetical protein